MMTHKDGKSPTEKLLETEKALRDAFCVEVTEPLTLGDAREIAGQLYNGGVPAAIRDNGNGTYTVWRKPFSDDMMEMHPSAGLVENCIMKRKHPKRENLMEVLEP